MEVAGGKYPPLATDTVMNNCLSIYYNSEIIEHKIDNFYCCQRSQGVWRRSLGGAEGETVNSTGYPDFEWPIRAHEKHYPLF